MEPNENIIDDINCASIRLMDYDSSIEEEWRTRFEIVFTETKRIELNMSDGHSFIVENEMTIKEVARLHDQLSCVLNLASLLMGRRDPNEE